MSPDITGIPKVRKLKHNQQLREMWANKRSICNYIHNIEDDRYNNNNGKHTFPTPTPKKPTLHFKTTKNKTSQQHSNWKTQKTS